MSHLCPRIWGKRKGGRKKSLGKNLLKCLQLSLLSHVPDLCFSYLSNLKALFKWLPPRQGQQKDCVTPTHYYHMDHKELEHGADSFHRPDSVFKYIIAILSHNQTLQKT